MRENFGIRYKNKIYYINEEKLISILEYLSETKIKRCMINKLLRKYKLMDEVFLENANKL